MLVLLYFVRKCMLYFRFENLRPMREGRFEVKSCEDEFSIYKFGIVHIDK